MNVIEIVKSIVLGIIQGITEWLPISSTGHLILFDNIWPMASSPEFFEVFKVVIQFGSILAVLVLFFHKLNPFSPRKSRREKRDTYNLWKKVIVGCIPIIIVGLPLDMVLEDYLSGVYVIAATLILYGIAFIVIESRNRRPSMRSLEDMAGASGLKLIKYFLKVGMFSGSEWILLTVGTVVSFLVSILAIRLLLSYIRKHDFKVFGVYRILLGIVVIVYFGFLV